MIVVYGVREMIKWYILGPKGEGVDNLFEIRTLNYFGGYFQMMFNMKLCLGSRDHEGELYVIIFLDIKGEGVGRGYRLPG